MRLPGPIEAVTFDMDGLLVDSERVYCEEMTNLARELGHDLPLATFQAMIGNSHEASAELILQTCGRDFDVAAYEAEFERRVDARDLPLKAGAVELMDVLEARGLPCALVTNSSRAAIERRVGRHGLIERFSVLVFKGEALRPKPAPDPYLLAAERLGVAPSACLALEDSYNGVRAACAAGMMTIMVPDMLDVTEEMHGLALRVEETLHDVRALLSQIYRSSRRMPG